MDEDLEDRVFETLPVVSSVCFHGGDKTHKTGFYVNLRCCATFSFGDCGTNQVGPIHMSSERPTLLTVYVNLDDESRGITSPRASLECQNCNLLKKMLLMRPQNVLWMRELCRVTQMTY